MVNYFPLPSPRPLATFPAPRSSERGPTPYGTHPPPSGWRVPPTTNRRYLVVTTQYQFESFLRRLRGVSYLTIDTEFSNMTRLELVQVGLPQGDAYILDPGRTSVDLTGFARVLEDPFILKVFHAPTQDLRILQSFFGVATYPVFDTQAEAYRQNLTSHSGGRIGYGPLVEAMLGIRLDKSLQRSDWTLPVLSLQQLDYAALDVIHLRDVYLRLIQPYFR